MTPKDKLGNEIKIGSIIAYGHTLGRCAGLRIGKVLDIKKNENARHQEDAWRFTVQGIDDDWFYAEPWNYSKATLTSRKGSLGFVTRIIVLPESQIPKEYLILLN